MPTFKIVFISFFLFFVLNAGAQQQKQFKALVVSSTRGWHHESLHYGFIALQQLGTKHSFEVTLWEDPNGFTDKYVEQFQVIVFLNTSGDIFDSAQQRVMERFIRSGKGYVGIHSASDTEYDWEWYTRLVGRMFTIHPVVQTAKLKLLDASFPGLDGFANGKLWTDEWYEFGPEKTKGLNYILGVDESTYDTKVQWGEKKGVGMGAIHPLAWYHQFDGGRSFYTALGHLPTNFSQHAFLDHLYAGIRWAATGKK